MRLSLSALLFLLVVGSAGPAHAGRNANGAMVVHTTDTVTYTSTADYCGAQFNNPSTCAVAGTRTDKPDSEPAVIWLLAAFLSNASPAVTGVQFGLEHNLPVDAGAFARYGACGSGVLELPDEGWPETGLGNTISFGAATTSKLFPFYWFAAYGSDGSYLGTGINPNSRHAIFTDDSNPPAEDECYNFGRIQWFAPGFNNCPVASSCQPTLTSPNGGEIWTQGTLHTISWTSSACDGPIRIDLLRADGQPCVTIADQAPNSGSYGWIAQTCLGGSGTYKIRLTDLRSGHTDESNQGFYIPDAPSCLVTVITPNGGESVDQGSSFEITWGSTACGANVKIELVQNGAVCATSTSSTANDGSYTWTALPCAGMCGYKIRITDLVSGAADESAEEFCFRPCSPHVDTPNGGEEWIAATENTILWTPGNCGPSAKIELLRNGAVCSTIAPSTPNDGSFTWTAQQCSGASDGYKVRVTDLSGDGRDDSDTAFRILACQTTVTSPNGGESWQAESAQTITWTSTHCGADVRIELLHAGIVCSTIAASTANDGSYAWTPSQCGGNRTDYRIRVTDLRGGLIDESDAVFSISDPPCAVHVTAPNGGESWTEGFPHDITWSSAHCTGTVKIELLLNGVLCATIAASTADDGLHTWTAQRCGSTSSGYTIRITDVASGAFDVSDAIFSIPPCQVTVTSPAGGSWSPGSSHSIRWSSTACGSTVRIDLVRNGSACTTISASTPNDGEFTWVAQQCSYGASGYKIRITDLTSGEMAESAAFCISCDDFFAIDPSTDLTLGHTGLVIPIIGGNDTPIRAYSIRICFDPAVLVCTDMTLAGTRGAGAVDLTKSIGTSCVTGTVTYATDCGATIPAGTGTYLKLIVNVKPTAPLGPTNLTFTAGIPPATAMTTCVSGVIGLSLQNGSVTVVPEEFRRGDDNGDGTIDIADPVYCLDYQYGNGSPPPCRDAGDFDDSGRYDITDCVANLCRQFGNCSDPPPPYASCGADPTSSDPLGCLSFPSCGNTLAARGAVEAGAVGRIVLDAPIAVSWDTLAVPVRVETGEPLIALQYGLRFDPSALAFAGIDRGDVAFDFYSARSESPAGQATAGAIPDLQLLSPIEPGRRSLGRLLFAVIDPSALSASRIDVDGIRFVGTDHETRVGDGVGVTLAGVEATDAAPGIHVANPFRPGNAILLELPNEGIVRVDVYDMQGRSVRTLFGDAELPRGRHTFRWDGRGSTGTPIGTGIYLLRVTAGSRTLHRKITLIR